MVDREQLIALLDNSMTQLRLSLEAGKVGDLCSKITGGPFLPLCFSNRALGHPLKLTFGSGYWPSFVLSGVAFTNE